MRILIYGNGSSGNHGCEAIVRGTVELLGKENTLYTIHSSDVDEDNRYQLCEIAQIRPARSRAKRDVRFLSAYAKLKFTGNYTDMDGLQYLPAVQSAREYADIALSAGGDNYCYDGTSIYGYLNRAYRSYGMKTVLWGCSVEPEVTLQNAVAKDLSGYDLIVSRESISYEALKEVNKNVILCPDPAFFMTPTSCELNSVFLSKPIIGINASPHILKCESVAGMAYENYRQLISYILQNTEAAIALIPHVVWASNDDRKVLRRLYDDFDQNERIVLVEDHSAPELKYIISRCDFFVGARTHATIAAYSSGVPTLVVGYSVKARGIARDLFGTEENYVLPVQHLTTSQQLTDAFCKLYEQKTAIQQHLHNNLPMYLKKETDAVGAIDNLR